MTTVPQTEAMPTERQPKAAPTGGFLANLSVPQKLLFSSLLLGIPLLGFAGITANTYLRTTEAAQVQAQAAQSFIPLHDAQNIARLLQGHPIEDVTPQMLKEFQDAAANLANAVSGTSDPLLQQGAEGLQTNSATLIDDIKAGRVTTRELEARTTQMLQDYINPLFRELAFAGQLRTGQSGLSDELVQLLTDTIQNNWLPAAQEFGNIVHIAAQARDKQGGVLTPEQRIRIELALSDARNYINAVGVSVEQIVSDYPEAAVLDGPFDTATDQTSVAFDQLEKDILQVPRITVSQSQLETLPIQYLTPQYDAADVPAQLLAADFQKTAELAQRNLWLLIGALGLLLLVLALTLQAVTRAITRPLNQLTDASQALARGQLNARVPVTSNDELGTLAASFNGAAAQLEENELRVEQERIEQQRLQNNIGQFLDVTMDIAEGDLTKRGVVTEDVLGNVVDSINLMTEELSYVLGDVQKASTSVTAGSQTMLDTTSQIEQGTALTAAEAQRVAQQVQELTDAVRRMSQQAEASADAARQALLASQQGQEAVAGTLDGMQNIRREVQGVAKSIKGLGDRSLEIQEIVDTISGIARQTNLLALNATIEAAGAGEAGGRFSIVADEVRKLADNSAAATGRIAQLIQNIQAEIQDVVVNVEESTREVEQGYRVAGTAGERLRQIGDLTQQSAQLAENISAATQEQVQGIEQMGSAVQQIAQIAQQSEESVLQGRDAAAQLQQLADQLNASLSRFRLPS